MYGTFKVFSVLDPSSGPVSNPAEILLINGHRYIRDTHGNIHQLISRPQYLTVQEFYRSHIYIGGRFWSAEILTLPPDRLAQLSEVEYAKAASPLAFFEASVSLNRLDAKVLELGSGCGAFLHLMGERGYRSVAGIDISPLAPVTAARLWGAGLNIEVREAFSTLSELPGSASYDLIVALDIIEHVWHDSALMRELAASLAPGGKVLIEVPVIPHGVTSQDLASYEFLYPEHHLHIYTDTGIIAALEVAGLRVVKTEVTRAAKKLFLIAEVH